MPELPKPSDDKGDTPKTELTLQVLHIKKVAIIFRAVNHSLRQQILKLLHGHGKMTVTEIYIQLRLEQAVVSQHLAILRQAGFVKAERGGKFIFYSVNHQRLKEIHQFSLNILG